MLLRLFRLFALLHSQCPEPYRVVAAAIGQRPLPAHAGGVAYAAGVKANLGTRQGRLRPRRRERHLQFGQQCLRLHHVLRFDA